LGEALIEKPTSQEYPLVRVQQDWANSSNFATLEAVSGMISNLYWTPGCISTYIVHSMQHPVILRSFKNASPLKTSGTWTRATVGYRMFFLCSSIAYLSWQKEKNWSIHSGGKAGIEQINKEAGRIA
jgi:hypothetical protein